MDRPSTTTHNNEQSVARLLPVQVVCELLSLSRSKVYGLMESGALPFVKFGKSRRVRSADVQKLIEENLVSRG